MTSTSALRPTGGPARPRIAIVGAGPAGLVLGCLLMEAGRWDCTIVERQSRSYVESRPRAGLLEYRTVWMLSERGLQGRLPDLGAPHDGCEFRVNGTPVLVKFDSLVGASQWVWPQQELVTDLIAEFLARGGNLEFDAEDVEVSDVEGDAPVVSFTGGGRRHHLHSDWVAGADGSRGVSRAAIPAAHRRTFTHEQAFAWVAVLAATPPSAPHIIYAPHERGFAGHMLRTPPPDGPGARPTGDPATRFYLQAPRGDDLALWPDERVWAELDQRLAVPADPQWRLRTGPIIDKTLLEMRSVVTDPMQYGRLFLLGDAAHVITPVGAKGMNLAIHDAEVLAAALGAWDAGEEAGLVDYSRRCLARIWRCQAFSHALTRLLHRSGDPFQDRLHDAALEHLLGSEAELTAFAQAYVGVD